MKEWDRGRTCRLYSFLIVVQIWVIKGIWNIGDWDGLYGASRVVFLSCFFVIWSVLAKFMYLIFR